MIRSFRRRDTQRLFEDKFVRRFRAIERSARRKLEALNAATSLADLGLIPGNRLETLRGDREGQHSIRINDQWRLCFEWREGDSFNVEIVDCH
ncbi:MAG TPA: type II toxin-antitoxin system RelE/ParE family toxin [Thermoanaerobaculia bacterium]|nr:type II toxin-antitoxin system RelE/ParE family toxin [Thermoanaerobaculia bacterium]